METYTELLEARILAMEQQLEAKNNPTPQPKDEGVTDWSAEVARKKEQGLISDERKSSD